MRSLASVVEVICSGVSAVSSNPGRFSCGVGLQRYRHSTGQQEGTILNPSWAGL